MDPPILFHPHPFWKHWTSLIHGRPGTALFGALLWTKDLIAICTIYRLCFLPLPCHGFAKELDIDQQQLSISMKILHLSHLFLMLSPFPPTLDECTITCPFISLPFFYFTLSHYCNAFPEFFHPAYAHQSQPMNELKKKWIKERSPTLPYRGGMTLLCSLVSISLSKIQSPQDGSLRILAIYKDGRKSTVLYTIVWAAAFVLVKYYINASAIIVLLSSLPPTPIYYCATLHLLYTSVTLLS